VAGLRVDRVDRSGVVERAEVELALPDRRLVGDRPEAVLPQHLAGEDVVGQQPAVVAAEVQHAPVVRRRELDQRMLIDLPGEAERRLHRGLVVGVTGALGHPTVKRPRRTETILRRRDRLVCAGQHRLGRRERQRRAVVHVADRSVDDPPRKAGAGNHEQRADRSPDDDQTTAPGHGA